MVGCREGMKAVPMHEPTLAGSYIDVHTYAPLLRGLIGLLSQAWSRAKLSNRLQEIVHLSSWVVFGAATQKVSLAGYFSIKLLRPPAGSRLGRWGGLWR